MTSPIFLRLFVALAAGALFVCPIRAQNDGTLRTQALQDMKRAAEFYRGKVASHGGYVYYYSPDLSERWGEGKSTVDTIFVQPPGTPTVGMAYLNAHAAAGDAFYLDAARETARALVHGQLQSGGWTQVIHFAPAKRMGKYRNGKGGSWNASSLDDGQTQAALQFLIRVDQALSFKDGPIHEAVTYGLDSLLKAQFPNGAFPQVWTGPVARKPVKKAQYPGDNWRTEGKIKNYWDHYTLNDGIAGTVADTLIRAHEVYKDARYKAALEKLGDFLLLAQMPELQPGWCQQYNDDMVPIWARKFEPPAITGWESQDAMETLIKIASYAKSPRYLDAIPRALEYFNKCLLPDGKIARYYEFKTNKPLYMDSKYQLTYDASAAPGHYGWKQSARFKDIEDAFKIAKAGVLAVPTHPTPTAAEVRRILSELDVQGRWISTYMGEPLVGQPKFSEGFRFLSSDAFRRNLDALSAYVSAK